MSHISILRLCFLGCGKICATHAKKIGKIDNTVALSFASRDILKSNEYKMKFGGKFAFEDYNKAINSDQIDAVFITTPPDSHFSLAKSALENGKHVIIEKPPVFHSSELELLGNLADQNGLQLMVAENYYYKPLRTKIAECMKEDWIGKAIFFNINATKKQQSKGDWRDDASVAKFGSLFEGGIHWINFINNIGFVVKNAMGFVHDAQIKLERSIQASCNTDKGTIINLFYSWEIDTIFKGLRLSRIYGTEGSITFESNGLFIFVRGKKIKLFFPGFKNITGIAPMLLDFMEAIKQNKTPQFTWQMAVKDLRLIEEIYGNIKNN